MRTERDLVSETLCSQFFRTLDDGESTKNSKSEYHKSSSEPFFVRKKTPSNNGPKEEQTKTKQLGRN
jgi:hypothetical protein